MQQAYGEKEEVQVPEDWIPIEITSRAEKRRRKDLKKRYNDPLKLPFDYKIRLQHYMLTPSDEDLGWCAAWGKDWKDKAWRVVQSRGPFRSGDIFYELYREHEDKEDKLTICQFTEKISRYDQVCCCMTSPCEGYELHCITCPRYEGGKDVLLALIEKVGDRIILSKAKKSGRKSSGRKSKGRVFRTASQ